MDTRDSRADEPVVKPSVCPFCNGRVVDTLAKVITPATAWRCRTCDKTWTVNSLKGRL